MPLDLNRLELTKLSKQYDVSKFDCEEQSLNEFIQKEALIFQEERLGITYLAWLDGKLAGFVTISMADLRTEKMEFTDKLSIKIENYPCLQIGRLATDKQDREQGLGSYLIQWCMKKAVEYSDQIGCRLVVLNAKPNSVNFYKNRKFKMLKGQDNRREKTMYLVIPKEMLIS